VAHVTVLIDTLIRILIIVLIVLELDVIVIICARSRSTLTAPFQTRDEVTRRDRSPKYLWLSQAHNPKGAEQVLLCTRLFGSVKVVEVHTACGSGSGIGRSPLVQHQEELVNDLIVLEKIKIIFKVSDFFSTIQKDVTV
jgi:hypothetical protein